MVPLTGVVAGIAAVITSVRFPASSCWTLAVPFDPLHCGSAFNLVTPTTSLRASTRDNPHPQTDPQDQGESGGQGDRRPPASGPTVRLTPSRAGSTPNSKPSAGWSRWSWSLDRFPG